MKKYLDKVLFLLLVTASGCVTQFIPETGVDPELFVVEGMITNQQGQQSVKISKSIPIGSEASFNPVRTCNVFITDNVGNNYPLTITTSGTFVTSETFKGEIGRKYMLHIDIYHIQQPGNKKIVDFSLKSTQMEMLPVPKIDSLYYEKIQLSTADGFPKNGEGCKILLNTSDPSGKCRFYRWDYNETWKIIAPLYQRTRSNICWINTNSDHIDVKAAGNLNDSKINQHLIKFFSNESDRLSVRYRIEVNQYSVTENEYDYWNNLEKLSEGSGTIHDRIPSSIEGNMFCFGKPEVQVLGYFSVSAKSTGSIYINGPFQGLVFPYYHCTENYQERAPSDYWPPPGLFDYDGIRYWIVEFTDDHYIITDDQTCIDCTLRGTNIKPSFWVDR